VALVGGYLADVVYSQPVALTGLATDPSDLEALGASTSRYEGPIGILGVLDDRLRREGLSVLSLWAGLPHYIDASPNPRGALALVQALSELLEIDVDQEPLRLESAEFEERVSKVVAADTELADYVRRLKKREFAS
jgi:predicted ATP-grasp superfamily ATP-dependent carboligase